MDSEVLTLLLTARYVGSPAFNSLAKDIDVLTSKANGLAKTGAAISAVGTGITALTVGLAVGVGEAIKNASQFENSMNRVWTVLTDGGKNTSDLSAKNFSTLEAQILQTSDTYGQSANSIAQGTYFIMSALGGMGYKAKDVISNQIIPAFGAFVAASGNGLSGATDWVNGAKQVVHILGAMHEPISQWANDLGILTAAENNSSLSQTNLVTALMRFAPSATLYGLNFKQTVGLMSAEAEAGVYGSRAGTEAASAYRMLFTSPASLKALTALGITRDQLFKAAGQGSGVLDPGAMFALLQGRLQNIKDPAQRMKLANELFGAVGYRGLGPLMQQYASTNLGMAGNPTYYAAIMSKLQNSGLGSMLGVSQGMMQTFAAQVARLGTNFHNFLTLIGGPLITALTPIIKRLADALSSLNDTLINLGQKNGGGSGGILAGLGKALGWLPGAAFGTIGAGAILGPGMTYGGGLLRDWALNQDRLHGSYLKDLARWSGRADRMRADGSPMMIEFGRQRVSFLEELVTKTTGGRFALKGAPDRELIQLLNKSHTAKGAINPMVDFRLREHINKHWDELAKAYGFDKSGGPALSALEDTYLSQRPEEVLSASGAARRFFANRFAQAWAFGNALSPVHLLGRAGRAGLGFTDKHLATTFNPFGWLMETGFPAIGHGIMAAPGAALRGVKALPGLAWGGIKNIGGGLLDFIKVLPGAIGAVVSFGSALVPIVAVVLLVVGAITALVLIFTRYRKEAMQVAEAIGKGLQPVFKFFAGFVQNTLGMIGKAWSDHKKEIDGAMKGLLKAFQSALPFFQVVGYIIATVLGVVIRVVGYLVSGFLDALPHIINFFSAIFKVLGDLGRIIMDIVQGKWGKAWEDAKTLLGHAWEGIKELLRGLWSFITGVFGRLWKDIGPALGQLWKDHLQPFFAALPSKIGELLGNLGNAIGGFFQSHGPQINAALADLWNNHMGPFFASIPGKIGGALVGLAGTLAGGIGQGLQALFSGGGGKGGKGSTSLLGGLGAALGPALQRLWTDHLLPFFLSLPGKLLALAGTIMGKSGEIWQWIGKHLPPALADLWKNHLLPFFKSLPGKLLQLAGTIMGKSAQIWQWIGKHLPPALADLWKNHLKPFFESLPGKIGTLLGTLGEHIGQFWKDEGPKIQPALKKLWDEHLKPFFKSLPGKILDLLGWLITHMPQFWATVGHVVLVALGWLWKNVLFPFFKSLPGKILDLLGWLITHMPQFWLAVGRVVDKAEATLWTNVIFPFFQSLPGKIITALQGLGQMLWNLFVSLGQKAVDGFKNGLAGIGGALHNALSNVPGGAGVAHLLHVPGFATGGDILRTQLAMVGEKGPELVRLPGGSHVYPHNETSAMLRPISGGSKMLQLHVASLHVGNVHGLEHLGQQQQAPGKTQRTPAEEYLFARSVQAHREAVWDRFPNTSRSFDSTYRRAYQYYG